MIVLVIILAVLILLLICPVSLTAQYESELQAKISYLFFSYNLDYNQDEAVVEIEETGKEEEKKIKIKTNDTIEKIKDIIKQKGLSGFLNIIKEFASIAVGAAKKLFSHMIVDSLSTNIAVANGDAAETAILYGNVCSIVYTSMGILIHNLKCKDYHIHIVPDFQSSESRIQFRFQAHIKLCFLVTAGLAAFYRFIKAMKLLKTPAKVTNEK